MKTKEEIMKNAKNALELYSPSTQIHLPMIGYLIIELLCDIRDDQINHNKEMERLVENLREI